MGDQVHGAESAEIIGRLYVSLGNYSGDGRRIGFFEEVTAVVTKIDVDAVETAAGFVAKQIRAVSCGLLPMLWRVRSGRGFPDEKTASAFAAFE